MFMDMLSQYNFYFLVIKIFLNCPFNFHSNLWYLWQFLICKQALNQQSHCQVTTTSLPRRLVLLPAINTACVPSPEDPRESMTVRNNISQTVPPGGLVAEEWKAYSWGTWGHWLKQLKVNIKLRTIFYHVNLCEFCTHNWSLIHNCPYVLEIIYLSPRPGLLL